MACRIRHARVAIQHIPKLEVDLPVTLDYLTADFNRDARADLNQAEK
jgi:acetolactate decarboxylase